MVMKAKGTEMGNSNVNQMYINQYVSREIAALARAKSAVRLLILSPNDRKLPRS